MPSSLRAKCELVERIRRHVGHVDLNASGKVKAETLFVEGVSGMSAAANPDLHVVVHHPIDRKDRTKDAHRFIRRVIEHCVEIDFGDEPLDVDPLSRQTSGIGYNDAFVVAAITRRVHLTSGRSDNAVTHQFASCLTWDLRSKDTIVGGDVRGNAIIGHRDCGLGSKVDHVGKRWRSLAGHVGNNRDVLTRTGGLRSRDHVADWLCGSGSCDRVHDSRGWVAVRGAPRVRHRVIRQRIDQLKRGPIAIRFTRPRGAVVVDNLVNDVAVGVADSDRVAAAPQTKLHRGKGCDAPERQSVETIGSPRYVRIPARWENARQREGLNDSIPIRFK